MNKYLPMAVLVTGGFATSGEAAVTIQAFNITPGTTAQNVAIGQSTAQFTYGINDYKIGGAKPTFTPLGTSEIALARRSSPTDLPGPNDLYDANSVKINSGPVLSLSDPSSTYVGLRFDIGTSRRYGVATFDQSAVLTQVAYNAVPEPAAWAMLIAGFGVVGGAVRRRRAQPAALA